MRVFRHVYGLLSPGGKQGKLSTFVFHRVWAGPDPIFVNEPDVVRFREILSWISTWFNVLPLDEAVARLRSDSLPPRAAAITFDDGYADNYTRAFPLLREFGMTATFFVATGFLDGGRMWNDTVNEAVRRCTLPVLDLAPVGLGRHVLDCNEARRQTIFRLIELIKYADPSVQSEVLAAIEERSEVDLPDDLMMTSQQVCDLVRAGMQIGAHTMHHPILALASPGLVEAEILGSRDTLEKLIGQRVGLFAYPNGKPGADFRPSDVEIVRRLGFDAAVTTAPGVANAATDRMQLPRFTPWDRSEWRFGVKLLANYFHRPGNGAKPHRSGDW